MAAPRLWRSCSSRGRECEPSGPIKPLHDGHLFQQCRNCGKWVAK